MFLVFESGGGRMHQQSNYIIYYYSSGSRIVEESGQTHYYLHNGEPLLSHRPDSTQVATAEIAGELYR